MSVLKIPVDDFWVLGMTGAFAIVARQAAPDYAALADGKMYASKCEPQIELRISPQTARSLLATLTQAIGRRYEEAFGPILMPERAFEARH